MWKQSALVELFKNQENNKKKRKQQQHKNKMIPCHVWILMKAINHWKNDWKKHHSKVVGAHTVKHLPHFQFKVKTNHNKISLPSLINRFFSVDYCKIHFNITHFAHSFSHKHTQLLRAKHKLKHLTTVYKFTKKNKTKFVCLLLLIFLQSKSSQFCVEYLRCFFDLVPVYNFEIILF